MKYVDLSGYGFVTEPRYYFYGWSSSSRVLARESVAKLLLEAKSFLPKGYNLKIWDGQRPLAVQLKMIENFRRRIKHANPGLSEQGIGQVVDQFCAKPVKKVVGLDTHRNGGSLDLTIIDQQGKELYMGTEFDDATERAATDYFERQKKLVLLEAEAKKNRRLLIKAMSGAGFTNYAPEWWHWSYDK